MHIWLEFKLHKNRIPFTLFIPFVVSWKMAPKDIQILIPMNISLHDKGVCN